MEGNSVVIEKPSPKKLCGNVSLTTFSPALITFMRARLEEGATVNDVCQEFGVSKAVVTAVRRTNSFNRAHVTSLKKNLPDAFASVVSSALSNINPEKLANCSAPQLMMVAGVAYDKLRLAQGESTANVSFRDAGSQAINVSQAADEMLSGLANALALPAPAE